MSGARFIAAARLELLAEVIHYGEVQPGLGGRFAAAVEEAAARALAFPLAGSPSTRDTERDGIVVFAVAHYARRPNYWHSRVSQR